jgi:hypothetical protein
VASSWLLPISVTTSASSEIELGCPGVTAKPVIYRPHKKYDHNPKYKL